MSLPDGIETVTLTGSYTHPGGTPMRGSVRLKPTSGRIVSAATSLTVQGEERADFDADGDVAITVVASDATGINPSGGTYQLTISFYDAKTVSFPVLLPKAAPAVKLSAITPVTAEDGDYVIVTGPAGTDGQDGVDGAPGTDGPSAYEVAVAEGFAGTEAEWLASLVGAQGQPGDPASNLITSVNGDTGAVVLDAAAVGADPEGSASSAQSAAISAAATDATTKANAAQAAAISAAAADAMPDAVVTVADLLAENPFYIAHRGSGGVYPEHTLAAYRSAVASGAKAIEVSVQMTADGVPVCIHDTTLDRTTYSTGAANTWTLAELRNRVLTNGKLTLGQGWTDQPIPTLREVMDELYGRVVIFLEPKGNDSVVPVQQLLAQYPHANRSVVWKTYYASISPWPAANGYDVWAYVDTGTTDGQMDAVAAGVTMWGVPTGMADARITAVVARGLPVISWEVHRRSMRDRLAALGVDGMMCPEIAYVTRATAMRTADHWTQQVKEPGGLATAGYDSTYSLKFDDSPLGAVYVNAVPNQSYCLGAIGPIVAGAGGYRIRFDMMFEALPGATEHAGIAFGKSSDDVYRFNTANASGGYHIAFRASGDMQLYTHTAGVTAGTQLGTIATTAPTAGGWMSFEVDVTATQVILRRTDVEPDVTLTVTNTAHRGLYMHLSGGSVSSLANKPHWRNVSIVQL